MRPNAKVVFYLRSARLSYMEKNLICGFTLLPYESRYYLTKLNVTIAKEDLHFVKSTKAIG